MATTRSPRKGSLQYWPRKRARRSYSRVRSYAGISETKPLGFAGYKVGMTHLIINDNRPNSLTRGESIFYPATIIECPPLKISSIRFYKKTPSGLKLCDEILIPGDKELNRRIRQTKKDAKEKLEEAEKKIREYAEVRINVCTQPKLTSIGKKKPEIFELVIGGNDIKQKFEYIKQKVGKEIMIRDVLREGQQVDVYAVTKGKGFQGPVKRFGIAIRQHKSEKTKRGPGSLGPWTGHRLYTVAHAGQTGFHNRMEKNKWILKISDKPEEINQKGGFLHYGNIKNNYVLIKGSIQGPAKRLIRMNYAQRLNKHIPIEAPIIEFIRK